MAFQKHKFGSTIFAKVHNSHELKQVLDGPWLDSETIIIKPNWVSTEPGDFTDADTLRVLLKALDAKVVVTESYCLGRSLNLMEHGLGFIVEGKEVNWEWLLKGDGWRWLEGNQDWDWFKNGEHWNQIIKEDKTFLDKYGFTDLFNEFNVRYVNVTEEVWNGRIANPMEVKEVVESKYKPVHNEKLYYSNCVIRLSSASQR
jgi:hypothetical protein